MFEIRRRGGEERRRYVLGHERDMRGWRHEERKEGRGRVEKERKECNMLTHTRHSHLTHSHTHPSLTHTLTPHSLTGLWSRSVVVLWSNETRWRERWRRWNKPSLLHSNRHLK